MLECFPENIKTDINKSDGGWHVLPSHINLADARQRCRKGRENKWKEIIL